MTEETKRSFDKIAGIALIVLLASYCFLLVLNVWTEMFDAEIFGKISVTYGVVIGLSVVVYLIRREFFEDKKLKDENYLD